MRQSLLMKELHTITYWYIVNYGFKSYVYSITLHVIHVLSNNVQLEKPNMITVIKTFLPS